MQNTQTRNIALEVPVHKDLKRIADRKGWKMRHAAKEAVAALKEKESRLAAAN